MATSDMTFGPTRLNGMLNDLNRESGFPIAVIANSDGLVVATSSSNGFDPQRQSAVVGKVREIASLVTSQLRLGTTDEIMINDDSGQRLVCRPFSIGDREFVLAVMIPLRRQSYRRVTNTLIREIRKHWTD